MFFIKHIGLYVADLTRMGEFYQKALRMIPLQEEIEDHGFLYDQLYDVSNASASVTKLVSEYGAAQRRGDMLELVCTEETFQNGMSIERTSINLPGSSHIAFGVEDIEDIVEGIKFWGGIQRTDILTIGSRKCCFCQDPEGNWIELIE